MAGVVEHHSPVRCKLHSTAIAFTVFAAFAVLIWLESKRGLYLGIAVAMVIAMLTDAVFARRAVAELVIEVHPPPDGCVGERVRWPVQTTGWNRPVVLRPLLVGGLGGYLVDDPLPGVMTIIPTRKGTLGVLALDVVTTGPLGLIGAGRRLFQELAQPLCFGPKPIEAEGRWPWTVPTGVGAVHSTPRGDELFRAVRPYRRGDDRRRVDWKTTARHGELMVRELDGTGTARIRVVADLGPHGPDADRAAGLAAWVATTALAAGYEVELIHQVAAYLTWVVSIMAVCGADRRPETGVAFALALGAAVALTVATPIGERLERSLGGGFSPIVTAGLLYLLVFVVAKTNWGDLSLVSLAAPVVLAWKWLRAERLRTLVAWSVLPLLIGTRSHAAWTGQAALLWGLLAMTTLYLLEVSRRAALAQIRALPTGEARPRVRSSDLAATITTALAAAAALALVVSAPVLSKPAVQRPSTAEPGRSRR